MMGTNYTAIMMWLVASASLLSMTVVPSARGATQSDYYNLINSLFNDYKAEVRPTNDDTFTTVNIVFWLLSIQNLDEKNQVLSTSLILQASWIDPWLTWDPATYGNITMFRYPQEKLWLPDIVVTNSVESQHQLGYDDCPLTVNHEGLVRWFPSEIAETSCDIDVTYYPFDTQICNIIVSTWVSTSSMVDLDLAENETDIVKNKFSPSGTWELSESSIQAIANEDDFTRLKYTFKLRRLSSFYILNILLPVLFLSLTASAVFYLPSECGEKIGMSMTILLSYAVYLTIISDNMPQTSLQISILSVYLTLLLGIAAVSVVLSVLVLHWHHKPEDEKVGEKTTWLIRKFRALLHITPKSTNGSSLDLLGKQTDPTSSGSRAKNGKISPAIMSNGKIRIHVDEGPNTMRNEEEKDEKITWQIVSCTIDSVFFITTSISIVLLTVIVMLTLVIGGAYQNARD